ncbi:MAG TPA: phage tail tape measure protein [Beijerinckiaceae bacterium]|jgi:phage-related minor tail protein
MPDDTLDRDNERRRKQLEDLDRLSQRFGASLSGALHKSAGEGSRLGDVLGRIGRTLLVATTRAAMKPLRSGLEEVLKSALGGSGSSLAGGGGAEAGTALAHGGVVLRGMVMPFAKGGVVAAPTYFPLARGLGLMGEAGSEAVMPLARGPDGRLGVAAGGGTRPVQVTVNIATPDADSFRRSEAQVAAALARAVARGQRGL